MTHSTNSTSAQYPDSPESREQNAGRRRISSQQLFATQNEVVIEHKGEDYRLRITSNDKLILTK